MMQDQFPVTFVVRSSDVAGHRERRFDLHPDSAARGAIAALLGIEAVNALQFKGVLRPEGRRDVVLEGLLEARVVQACVVTLQAVKTRIAVDVLRRYVAGYELAGDIDAASEMEMPEDDTTEPLPEVIDVGAVMIEALALALPDYPRAPDAGLGAAVFAPPGAVPLHDEDLRPFAALAALKLSGTLASSPEDAESGRPDVHDDGAPADGGPSDDTLSDETPTDGGPGNKRPGNKKPGGN